MTRLATPADVDVLLDLRVLMFTSMGTPLEALSDPAWRAEARAWLAAHVDHPATRIVVVEDGGEVVAGGVAEVLAGIPAPSMPRGRLGFISNVATFEHARGRGHGRAVMTDLVGWLEGDGDADRIDLAATEDGAHIYRTMGFTDAAFPTMRRFRP
ncbi:ribosomal protein S18 acetylase RimI-like enzyme [Knoellia remsis]|uniref:Ribosomal protein S18 acetylase RimI-like enzyme n=1 Tax=Knoellia remsis TaxID=407159 RepID=A0A2T0UYC4_9MICO|nr:GNAT family N-acetyltransferase [Knoellia remsis]PRY62921.1 ribosomal protein S18 acetylase RimI-like enzyme [Knoellia remsis]